MVELRVGWVGLFLEDWYGLRDDRIIASQVCVGLLLGESFEGSDD